MCDDQSSILGMLQDQSVQCWVMRCKLSQCCLPFKQSSQRRAVFGTQQLVQPMLV
jgi:hypothetical protein